jgi:hypothetical protein
MAQHLYKNDLVDLLILSSVNMDDFLLDIHNNTFHIQIESLLTNYIANNNIVDININNDILLVLESSIIDSINNLEVQRYNDYNLILTNTVYANLPDEIPISIISGNLPVSRVDGLDEYLATIPVDGGTP